MYQITLPQGVTLNTSIGDRTVGESFDAILRWDTSDIRDRIVESNTIPMDEIDIAIEECRKFFMCIVIAHVTKAGSVGMMSKKVDEVWHNAILFTREYFALSEAILGKGRYLHHAPVTKRTSTAEVKAGVFQQIYAELFGRIPAIWGVRYENDLIWEDAMQGRCVVEQNEDNCQAVCHPDSCNGCSGQLCNNIPEKPILVPQLADCDSPSCSDGSGCTAFPCYDTSCRGD